MLGPVLRILGRRLVQFLPVVALATFVVYSLLSLVPGDLAILLAGDQATPQHIEEVRHLYGPDRPFPVQYADWLWHALHGDLSHSLLSGESVARLVLQRLPNTLLIASGALVIGLVVGIPLGIQAALRFGSGADRLVSAIASLGVALPSFWLGMILVTVFALGLQWFPSSGSASLLAQPGEALHAALPALALAGNTIAAVAQQLRSALIEVLSSQYVRTLYAKGLSPAAILWKHGMRNVSVTLIAVVGLMVNRLLASTVVVEAVFAIPGTGNLIAFSAINKEFPVMQGVVLVLVLAVLLTNLLVDISVSLFDPRLRRG